MSLSKRLRYEVLRRDNYACKYCGTGAPNVVLVVDHVLPVALGGGDDPSNLVAACQDCNSGKSATPPSAPLVQDVAQDALRWKQAMACAQKLDDEDRETRINLEAMLYDYIEHVWRYHFERNPPDDCLPSLLAMYYAGGCGDDFEEAAGITRRASPDDDWRYFCGVVWRMIGKRQERARQLLTDGIV